MSACLDHRPGSRARLLLPRADPPPPHRPPGHVNDRQNSPLAIVGFPHPGWGRRV